MSQPKKNPADIGSRGSMLNKISDILWKGLSIINGRISQS